MYNDFSSTHIHAYSHTCVKLNMCNHIIYSIDLFLKMLSCNEMVKSVAAGSNSAGGLRGHLGCRFFFNPPSPSHYMITSLNMFRMRENHRVSIDLLPFLIYRDYVLELH